jgi:hypothetical protein
VLKMQSGSATALDWCIDSVRKAGHVSIVLRHLGPATRPERRAAQGRLQDPRAQGGRWMLLIVADRIDVWEGRIARHPLLTGLALAAIGSGFWWRRSARPAR